MKKILLSLLLTCTLHLHAEKFVVGYTMQSSTAVPATIEINLPKKWLISKGADNNQTLDALYNKKQSVYMRMTLMDLDGQKPQEYLEQMVNKFNYKKHTIDAHTIISEKSEAYGGVFYNIRTILDHTPPLLLSTSMYPYPKYKDASLESELEEVLQILATSNIASMPSNDNMQKAKDAKYQAIKKEVDTALSKTTLIDEEGKLEDVNSFCMSLETIPFKYIQDKKAPQWIKDYTKNGINLCKGKLYTGALIKHLDKEGKASCTSLKVVLDDIYFITPALRKTGDIKMWDTLQTKYKKICK